MNFYKDSLMNPIRVLGGVSKELYGDESESIGNL
jgi:hypothetical protein